MVDIFLVITWNEISNYIDIEPIGTDNINLAKRKASYWRMPTDEQLVITLEAFEILLKKIDLMRQEYDWLADNEFSNLITGQKGGNGNQSNST